MNPPLPCHCSTIYQQRTDCAVNIDLLTHHLLFQFEILFCIQDLDDNDSYLYIQVNMSHCCQNILIATTLFLTLKATMQFDNKTCIISNHLGPIKAIYKLQLFTRFNVLAGRLLTIVFCCQELMKKFPEVDVKVFRGGETVGE